MEEKDKILTFTYDPVLWFTRKWGFVPDEEDLRKLFEREPGVYDLFRKIWSTKYLIYEQNKEMNTTKRKQNEK